MRFTWPRRALEIAGTAGLSAFLGIAAIGCNDPDPEVVDTPPPEQSGPPITSVAAAAQSSDFWAPLDASPSPEGDAIYFTASTPDGPAVLKVVPDKGPAEVISSGERLEAPFAVIPSFDGTTLYVADSGAENDDDEAGRIFSMPADGGEPTPITSADGTVPKSMTLIQENGADVIYFTGLDPATEMPAIMKMNADGSGLQTILAGEPLMDPQGIAVTSDGRIFVVDSGAGEAGTAAVLEVSGGNAERLVSDLRVGFPAGMSLDFNETALFVSGLAKQEASSTVYHVVIATGEVTPISDGISQNSESAGVHRAHKADVFAWANADGDEGDPAGGTVYLLKGPKAE